MTDIINRESLQQSMGRSQELIKSYEDKGLPLQHILELLGGQVTSVASHNQVIFREISNDPAYFVQRNPGLVHEHDAQLLVSPDTDPLTRQIAIAVATMSYLRPEFLEVPGAPGEFA